MSSILAFTPRSTNAAASFARQAKARAPHPGGAEIVIFPGVRYERLDAAPQPKPWTATPLLTTDAKQQA